MKLWYDHFRRDADPATFEPLLSEAIKDATSSGQIKKHKATGATNADNASMFTTCKALDVVGNVVATGYAFCTREATSNNRKAINRIGRDIARGRVEKLTDGV
ncbi:hypothetical protein KAR91_86985 [Candidatus Pacearchaeota archaeon]|nr:hypothetical protein [Candidatus Pacearchaeota archaeon]